MKIRENVTLAELTTLKIGGPARYFADVDDARDLPGLFQFARERGVPAFILGGGSNILMSDEGYPGLVIKLSTKNISLGKCLNADGVESDNERLLFIDAGASWDEVVRTAVENNCWGIENLSLIPGTVGGAIVQNIGAYGAEVSEVVHSVDIFDKQTKEVKRLSNHDCHFGYRDSIFKNDGKNFIILSTTLKLSTVPKPNISYKDIATYFSSRGNAHPTITEIREAIVHVRTEKFPKPGEYGTAGSFFKNPVVSTDLANKFLSKYPLAPHHDVGGGKIKLSAGWLIDHVLHMRGVRSGGVGCWDEQALVVVNYGTATSVELNKFVDEMQKKLFDETGIMLEPEVISVST